MQGGEPVNIKLTTWLVVALLQTGMAGNALAVTVYTEYTDRSAFEALVNPGTVTVEDFESYRAVDFIGNDPFVTPDPYFSPNGLVTLDLDYFSLSATPQAIKILDQAYPQPPVTPIDVHNTTSGGAQYLYLDTDNPGQVITGSTTTIVLDNPVDAFGFNYTGVFEPGTSFTVTIGTTIFNLSLNNPAATSLFWGVIGPGTTFDTITLTTSLDSGYGVDDVIFGSAVPLPPALWLFGSGLLALAGGARKTTAHG
jgi:hypothetical protein